MTRQVALRHFLSRPRHLRRGNGRRLRRRTVGARIQDKGIEQIAGGWGSSSNRRQATRIQRNVIRANGPLHPAGRGVIIASGEGIAPQPDPLEHVVGDGRASIFDTTAPERRATASDNCIEPNGAAVSWEADRRCSEGRRRQPRRTSRLRHVTRRRIARVARDTAE